MFHTEGRAEGRRLYEHIAEALAADIAAGRYPVGSRLPSERDLAQTFGVSRPTVREALIALEIDGLVEIKVGAGIFVQRQTGPEAETGADVGPFELLEARRMIESEICAAAASRISSHQLETLAQLVADMERENQSDVVQSERSDRAFHRLIAEATENSQLVAIVDSLWDARDRSPLIQRMSAKAQAAGVKPMISEHHDILAALRSGSPDAARAAMYEHLSRVIEALLEATEVEEVERARAKVAQQRQRLRAGAPARRIG